MTLRSLNRAVGEIDGAFVSEAENYFSAQGWQRRRRTRVLLLVAAILTALIAIGCAAVSYFEMDDMLKDFLGIEDEYNQDWNEGVAEIGISKTVGDFTVIVDQMFGDPHSAWIVFRTIIPEWAPLRPDEENDIYPMHYGDFLSVQLSTGSQSGSYGWSCIDIDDATRTKTYVLTLSGSNVNLIGRKITLIFSYAWMDEVGWPTGHFEAIIDEMGKPSSIEIVFRPQYRDMTQRFRVNETRGDYGIREVRISPASSIIRISNLPDDQKYIKACSLTMKDGSVVECYEHRAIKNLWWIDSVDVYSSCWEIVDPSEVKAVTFSVDEETFYTVDLE